MLPRQRCPSISIVGASELALGPLATTLHGSHTHAELIGDLVVSVLLDAGTPHDDRADRRDRAAVKRTSELGVRPTQARQISVDGLALG